MLDDTPGVGPPKPGCICGGWEGCDENAGDCGGPVAGLGILPIVGGNRGALCPIPDENEGGPLLNGPDVLTWVGVGGPDDKGDEVKGPGRGPEGCGAKGPPGLEGNAPCGGGLDAKGGEGCATCGGPVGLLDIIFGGNAACG